MLAPVGVRALAGDISLEGEGEHGDHGETAVLDLLHLQLLENLGVRAELEGIEGTAGVQLVHAVEDGGVELPDTGREPSRAVAAAAVRLDSAEKSDLNSDDNNEGQRVGDNAPRNGEVVQGAACRSVTR